ncbi:DUF1115-domain-containing protein [Myriangium duriaei CBS 260.36]|uniref:DUF1115-domain-containing protein n=1 Tax=Myriangium duriaei CBS 260.36 TaxID=1168546 RepID=A0A9P4MJB8_9PEZI|nr:DUF1115-domain-containing protein [Myriangium duriaei CBS 260.36]
MSENRERQLAELVLLQSMYPEEFQWQTAGGTEPSLSDIEDSDPSVSLKLDQFTLDLTLPSSYPSTSLPQAYLQCGPHIPTTTRKQARQHLTSTLTTLSPGEESLDLLVTSLIPLLASLTTTSPSPQPTSPPTTSNTPVRIHRLLLWAHHLLATSKRRDILSWSRDLRLSGFSRPGYPGAILVEGEAEDVAEFERRIKALRWQALQVRGEEDSDTRMLGEGQGVREVEELSEVVKALREVDGRGEMAEWFLEGMRIGHG